MGGSRLAKRKASTLYVRVARVDWPMVRLGRKTEFRTTTKGGVIPHALAPDDYPVAIVAWCPVGYGPVPEQRLMVCEAAWIERLGEITPESLAREGFASRREFANYWRNQRTSGRNGYKPLMRVGVYRVRPWTEGDVELCGVKLLERLYGAHLET